VLQQYREATSDPTITVIVSTASPYKFAPDVASSLFGAEAVENLDFFACAEKIEQVSGVAIPPQVRDLLTLPVRHDTVCAVSAMEETVLNALK